MAEEIVPYLQYEDGLVLHNGLPVRWMTEMTEMIDDYDIILHFSDDWKSVNGTYNYTAFCAPTAALGGDLPSGNYVWSTKIYPNRGKNGPFGKRHGLGRKHTSAAPTHTKAGTSAQMKASDSHSPMETFWFDDGVTNVAVVMPYTSALGEYYVGLKSDNIAGPIDFTNHGASGASEVVQMIVPNMSSMLWSFNASNFSAFRNIYAPNTVNISACDYTYDDEYTGGVRPVEFENVYIPNAVYGPFTSWNPIDNTISGLKSIKNVNMGHMVFNGNNIGSAYHIDGLTASGCVNYSTSGIAKNIICIGNANAGGTPSIALTGASGERLQCGYDGYDPSTFGGYPIRLVGCHISGITGAVTAVNSDLSGVKVTLANKIGNFNNTKVDGLSGHAITATNGSYLKDWYQPSGISHISGSTVENYNGGYSSTAYFDAGTSAKGTITGGHIIMTDAVNAGFTDVSARSVTMNNLSANNIYASGSVRLDNCQVNEIPDAKYVTAANTTVNKVNTTDLNTTGSTYGSATCDTLHADNTSFDYLKVNNLMYVTACTANTSEVNASAAFITSSDWGDLSVGNLNVTASKLGNVSASGTCNFNNVSAGDVNAGNGTINLSGDVQCHDVTAKNIVPISTFTANKLTTSSVSGIVGNINEIYCNDATFTSANTFTGPFTAENSVIVRNNAPCYSSFSSKNVYVTGNTVKEFTASNSAEMSGYSGTAYIGSGYLRNAVSTAQPAIPAPTITVGKYLRVYNYGSSAYRKPDVNISAEETLNCISADYSFGNIKLSSDHLENVLNKISAYGNSYVSGGWITAYGTYDLARNGDITIGAACVKADLRYVNFINSRSETIISGNTYSQGPIKSIYLPTTASAAFGTIRRNGNSYMPIYWV